MARKRTSHRRRTHRRRRTHHVVRRSRRRRIGAMALSPSSTMVQFGSVIGGYLLAGTINPLVDKVTGTMDAKIKSAIQVGLGGALVLGKLGKRSMLTVVPGGILAGAGIKRALQSFGVVTGYGMVDVVSGARVRGYNPQASLNGYQKVPTVGGYETAGVPINGPALHNRIMGRVGNGDELITKDSAALVG